MGQAATGEVPPVSLGHLPEPDEQLISLKYDLEICGLVLQL